MQLPWPFRRAQRSPSADGRAQSESAAAWTGPEARHDWRRLPPLRETIGPPPLLAPPRPFADALAASNPPPPILAPLSHGRSLEAPRGLVVGVARAVPAVAGPAMPRPVQRSPLAPGRRSIGQVEPEVTLDLPAPVADASTSSTPSTPSTPSTEVVAAVHPTSRLPVPSQGIVPGPRAFTRAPDPERTRPLLGLVGQPRAGGSARARPPEPPEPAIQRKPDTPVSLPSSPSTELAADAPRLTLGQTRRLGLGAPIAGGPMGLVTRPLPVAVESTTAGEMPTRRTASAPVASADTESSVTHATPASLPLAVRPLAETTPPGSAAATATSPAMPEGASAHATRSAGPAPTGRPVAASPPATRPTPRRETPLVSAQPLRSRVQRAPLSIPRASPAARAPASESPGSPTAGSIGAAGSPVRVHRGPAAGDMSRALEARSFTHGGEIYLPDSHGPLTTGAARSLLAHELTHVVQQRRFGSSLPLEHTPHGQALEAEAVGAERSTALPLAMPPHATSEPAAAAPDATPSAQRAPVGAATVATATTPRDDVATVNLTQGTQRSPAKPRGERKNALGADAPRVHSEQELEDLAHQLYSRIGRRLRRELLVDRERSGLAMDLP